MILTEVDDLVYTGSDNLVGTYGVLVLLAVLSDCYRATTS